MELEDNQDMHEISRVKNLPRIDYGRWSYLILIARKLL